MIKKLLNKIKYHPTLKRLFYMPIHSYKISGNLLSLLSIYPKKVNNYQVYSSLFKNKSGIEIGGPSQIFSKKGQLPVYPIASNIDICNIQKTSEEVSIICDAVDLKGIPDNKYDFVISSHVLEHITNPIKALKEWLRILKDDGIILLVIPHKEGNFDRLRKITSLQHIINDLNNNVSADDKTHINEMIELTDLKLKASCSGIGSFKELMAKDNEYRDMHHHVFNTGLIAEIYNYLSIKILSIDTIVPFNIIIAGQKRSSKGTVDNSGFLSNDSEWKIRSPFPSDKI